MSNLLYISHSKRGASHYYLDASARYRCVFPCENNNARGTSHCIHFDQLNDIQLDDYDTLIFHRPMYSRKLVTSLKKLKDKNINTIVDFDDLLFAPEYTLENPTYLSGQMSAKQAQKSAKKYLKALQLFQHAQVSTDRLKYHINLLHPDCAVTVRYNQLPERWVKLTPMVDIETRLTNKIIRYFPGTSHHTSNFQSSIETLNKILSDDKSIKLEVIGDIKIPEGTFPQHQFKQLPPVLFEELPEIIASSWLTISPLEDNEFNQCKSGLKFWESACFGVPVISNNNPDMERFTGDSLFISGNNNTWLEYIKRLSEQRFYTTASHAAFSTSQSCIYCNRESAIDHQNLHLIMNAHFGPSWPAIIYNPTHEQYKAANNHLMSNIDADQNNIIPENEKVLLNSKASKLKQATYKNQNKRSIYRKWNKLRKTPKLFFRDMILKRINTL